MENKQGHPPMTPDRSKAALGNATLLQSFLLPRHTAESKAKMAGNTQESAPQEEVKAPEQPKEDPMKAEMAKMELMFSEKLDAMRQEMKQDNQREMDNLKQTIKEAIDAENSAPKTAE